MPRENSKCREWEKQRRERLNEGFSNLAKALPCYDPSINICKIDILQKAAKNIHELQDRIKHLLSSDTEKKNEKEVIIKKLQDRVKKLLVRNEQLCNLLRDAGVSVPSVCGTIKKFKKIPLWSRRISPEQAEQQKNEMEKENIASVQHRKKKKAKAAIVEATSKEKVPMTSETPRKGTTRKNRKKKGNAASNCYVLLSQMAPLRNTFTQQYYLITNQTNFNNARNTNKAGVGSGTKSVVLKRKCRPLKSTIYPPTSLSSLGPGTLIIGSGLAVPILPQPQSLLPNSNNIILNPTIYALPKVVSASNVSQKENISVKNPVSAATSTNVKKLPFIKPKYCLTRTTQVNKVPIPALTSPYASNYCLFSDQKIEVKKKDVKTRKYSKRSNATNDLDKSDTEKSNKRKNDVDEVIDSKRCKNNLDNEASSTKPAKSDLVVISTSPVFNPNVKESITNTIETNDQQSTSTNKQAEKDVTNAKSKCEIEHSHSTEKLKKENTNCKEITCLNNFEKAQEVVINQSKDVSQTTLTTTSNVATTAVSTMAQDEMKTLEINLPHSELSNDIFASLQVPSGCQNPESTSPTAAFLLAFPLVSSGVKVTEVIDGENSESHSVTPTLLQIGTMETTKPTQSQSDVITSNFLNLDNFSFFSAKDICGSFDNNFPPAVTTSSGKSLTTLTTLNSSSKTNITNNPSTYVRAKSPYLPTSASEALKENGNVFCQKSTGSSKEISKDVKHYEKSSNSQQFSEATAYNAQGQPNPKSVANFPHEAQKNVDQKSQYHVPTTYPPPACDFSYRPSLTKTCVTTTCSYSNINRNYTDPLYTNSNNYNYNYHPDTNFNENYYKNISRNETKTYYPLNYENYPDYRKNDSNTLSGKYYDMSIYNKEKKNTSNTKTKSVDNKQPINWMTAPDNRLQTSECLLTSFPKSNFSQTYPFTSYVTSSSAYFSTATIDTNKMNCALETKKCLDLPVVPLNTHQRLDIEEKQFSWSPTKLPHFLDPPHTFVTSTLPTLVGDLALGNTLPFAEQKNDYKPMKENKDYRHINNSKVNTYENQSNFLSVSQLVDHSKPENIITKKSSRRNSGSRSTNNVQQKPKRIAKHDNKDILSHCGINDNMHQLRSTNNFNTFSSMDLFTDQKSKNATVHKNSSSSYSAEALIGNQVQDDSVNKRYPPVTNKSLGTPSFLAENIISYFPPVDLPQENYITQNQNYQPNNFTHNLTTSFQNNTYSSNSFIYTASTIAPSYLGTNSFESVPQDYLTDSINLMSNPPSKDNKHFTTKNCSKQLNKEERNSHHSICSNNVKRTKKKHTNDSMFFDFPFLSIHGSNNSPILPDDFHSHTNFLAPTTPFSCKNSLYPKQNNDLSGTALLPLPPPVCRSTIQHPEISPSTNAVGTSLTNFNLSTIFPEINKGPITDVYQDARTKQHLHHKGYSSTTPQVPFNTEPKFNFTT